MHPGGDIECFPGPQDIVDIVVPEAKRFFLLECVVYVQTLLNYVKIEKSTSGSVTETELPSDIFLMYRDIYSTGFTEGTGFAEALNNFGRSDKK